jgi:hypothetical protein
MNFRAKGQGALEYMMTYGWAVLVILAVGVVIWQMGILNMGADTTPGQRGFSQITPLDWKCATGSSPNTGVLTITFTNEAGTMLNISTANATMTAGGSGGCASAQGVPVSVLRPAQSTVISFTGCPVTGKKGEYYRADVGIVYVNPSSGIEHLSYGKLWGPLE